MQLAQSTVFESAPYSGRSRLTWVNPKAGHLLALVKPGAFIEAENASGDLANRSKGANCGTLQKEVFRPAVGAWVEEASELASSRNRANIASFGAVAERASISEVVRRSRTAVLYADDVIDFAAVEGICLGDEAVFAQLLCAVSNSLA